MLEDLPERLAAGILGVALGVDELHVVAPGGADHLCGALAYRGERDVLGPCLHPMGCGGNRCGARKNDHLDVVKVVQALLNKIAVLLAGQLDPERRPAPALNPLLEEHAGEAVVRFAGSHQNDGPL